MNNDHQFKQDVLAELTWSLCRAMSPLIGRNKRQQPLGRNRARHQ